MKEVKCELLNQENEYLKGILSLNSPILQLTHNNIEIKITKIQGFLESNELHFTLLVEAKDENKDIILDEIQIIDIEGNEYNVDYFKTSNTYPKLSLNVPLKRVFIFSNITNHPKIIKILKFRLTFEKVFLEKTSSNFEFKDLNVSWTK